MNHCPESLPRKMFNQQVVLFFLSLQSSQPATQSKTVHPVEKSKHLTFHWDVFVLVVPGCSHLFFWFWLHQEEKPSRLAKKHGDRTMNRRRRRHFDSLRDVKQNLKQFSSFNCRPNHISSLDATWTSNVGCFELLHKRNNELKTVFFCNTILVSDGKFMEAQLNAQMRHLWQHFRDAQILHVDEQLNEQFTCRKFRYFLRLFDGVVCSVRRTNNWRG